MWKKQISVYQIYPRSFCDSNGDGIGDIKGIIGKIDYIADLGVDAVWLSPVYVSPDYDNGYDIADYYDIDPKFGSMEDFDELLGALHERGIKLIMDLVVNHTSDKHEWFIKSRQSRDNDYRDYYIWREGRKGGTKPPNKWASFFPSSAWELDTQTHQYYLKLFTSGQPDLNWDNPKVRGEIKDILRFWLDKGVDGFRCDVINLISKTFDYSTNPPGLPEGKRALALRGMEHYLNGPRVHEYLHELHNDVFSKYDCLLVGEMPFVTPADVARYCRPGHREMDMVFSFEHMDCDNLFRVFKKPCAPKKLQKTLLKLQKQIDWNTLYFENHDQPRSVSRFGNTGKYRTQSAQALAAILYFLKGTPFIYQGQELGMANCDLGGIENYDDVQTRFIYDLLSRFLPKKFLLKCIKRFSRDNARTPFQWDNSPNAGFCKEGVKPWLPVNPDYISVNAAAQADDPDSVLSFYKKLLRLRRENIELVCQGALRAVKTGAVFIYERTLGNSVLTVIANMTAKNRTAAGARGEQVLSNYNQAADILRPFEVRIYKR